jgi:hypothetical protein
MTKLSRLAYLIATQPSLIHCENRLRPRMPQPEKLLICQFNRIFRVIDPSLQAVQKAPIIRLRV